MFVSVVNLMMLYQLDSLYMSLDDMISMNDEMEMICMKGAKTHFKVLSQYLSKGPEENHREPHSE
jgi:hypothetical protein